MVSRYSVAEKNFFIQILTKYPIIEDKKVDTLNIEKKKRAWDLITEEYNSQVNEKRTVVQLKRLWDKIKRARKVELAQEQRDLMAIGSGPSEEPPSLGPDVDNIIPLDYEIDISYDSDGIKFNKKEELPKIKIEMPDLSPTSTTEVTTDKLTEARLRQIELEENQMRELHIIKLEEANYRREEAMYRKRAAQLMVLQEEEKLKKIRENK